MQQVSIGSSEAIQWGRHVCHLYRDDSDLVRLLVPFFAAGIAHNECCVWITSGSLTVKRALEMLIAAAPDCRPYIQTAQLEVHPYTGWYSRNGSFDRRHLWQRLDDRLRAALNDGYDGLRVSGRALWLEKSHECEDFAEYEHSLDRALDGSRIVALFTYPLQDSSAADVLNIARHHGRLTIQSTQRYEMVQTLRPSGPRERCDGLNRLGLTPRETEVLRWVIEGKVTSEVGNILAISPRTVQKHLERIYQKLGVEGRTAAAVRGVEFLRDAFSTSRE